MQIRISLCGIAITGFVLAGLLPACQSRPEEPLSVTEAIAENISREQLLNDPVLSKSVDYTVKNPLPLTQESLDQGKKLYNLSCVVCHSETGAPGPSIAMRPTAPHFNRVEWSQNRQDGELFLTIQHGRAIRGMPSWKHFSAKDTWAIIHYVRSLSGTAKVFAEAAERHYQ